MFFFMLRQQIELSFPSHFFDIHREKKWKNVFFCMLRSVTGICTAASAARAGKRLRRIAARFCRGQIGVRSGLDWG